MDITGLTGVTAAQRADLLALGAVDRSVPATPARRSQLHSVPLGWTTRRA
jgi:hypothetical protein